MQYVISDHHLHKEQLRALLDVCACAHVCLCQVVGSTGRCLLLFWQMQLDCATAVYVCVCMCTGGGGICTWTQLECVAAQ